MAKFNIQVELDFLDEEQKIDDVLKDEIISSVKDTITKNATESVIKDLSSHMNYLKEQISKRVTEATETFMAQTFSEKIANMQIPYKENTWNSEFKTISMSEFVGMQYEQFLNKKVIDENGCEPRYSGDAKLSINEYFIKKYLEKELAGKVSKLVQTARKEAEESIIKTLEQTLKDQLSVDIIKRLNIPEMLKALQGKAVMLDAPKDKKP